MPWKIPANPDRLHPNRKFAFSRKVLYHFHVVLGLNAREISEMHLKMLGISVHAQGIRNRLKAYGFFEPGKVGDSNPQSPKNKAVKALLESWESKREGILKAS